MRLAGRFLAVRTRTIHPLCGAYVLKRSLVSNRKCKQQMVFSQMRILFSWGIGRFTSVAVDNLRLLKVVGEQHSGGDL